MESGRSPAVAIVALLVLTAPAGADGSEPSEAKAHFDQGVEKFQAADYEAALDEFRLAYELSPHFKVRYNIGITLWHLERYAEAETELKAYLLEGGGAVPEDERIEVQSILFELLQLLGSLELSCDVSGAKIWVDGRFLATYPTAGPLRMDAGDHAVEVKAEGYETYSTTIHVEAGESVKIDVELSGSVAPLSGTGILSPSCDGTMYKPEIDIYASWACRATYGGWLAIDGEVVGQLPLTDDFALEAGTHEVVVYKPYMETASMQVQIVPDKINEVPLALHPDPSKPDKKLLVAGGVVGLIGFMAWLPATIVLTLEYQRYDGSLGALLGASLPTGAVMLAGVGMMIGHGVRLKRWKEHWLEDQPEYLRGLTASLPVLPSVAAVPGGVALGAAGVF